MRHSRCVDPFRDRARTLSPRLARSPPRCEETGPRHPIFSRPPQTGSALSRADQNHPYNLNPSSPSRRRAFQGGQAARCSLAGQGPPLSTADQADYRAERAAGAGGRAGTGRREARQLVRAARRYHRHSVEEKATSSHVQTACMRRTSRSRRPCARGDVLCTEPGRSHPCPDIVPGRLGKAISRTPGMYNATLRNALYMPALSAMRHNPVVAALATRLKAQGRLKGKQIAVAAMRKLLVLCFGVLKSRKPFDPAVAMPN